MKVFALNTLLLGAALVLSLSACSSSSDPVPADTDVTPTAPGEQQSDQPGQNPGENPGQNPGQNPEDNPNEPVIVPPDVEPPIDNPDPGPGESQDPDILVPSVIEGSDLERLITGISQQASRTILDLAQRLSEGTLTEQQNDCLGPYDPAQGETLLSISCNRALATGDVALYVGEAAFYDTDACNASVFDGSTADCQLQKASITVRTEWIFPGPSQPPQPIAGMEIYYAIDNTILRIENTADMLTGAFRCDIELSNGQANAALTGQSCEDIISNAADRIEALLTL